MNLLVTGGAGYIGSILVQDLLDFGCKVTVLDNFHYNQLSLGHVCNNKNLEIIKGDVRNISLLQTHIKKADVIIPLAALVGAPICMQDPVGSTSINKIAVIEMFNSISSNQTIIMPTTNSAYGTGGANNYCTENSPLKPISKYAIDKVEIEKQLMDKGNCISFRLATVFGMSPRMRTDLLINDFVLQAQKNSTIVLFEKNFKRNFIHVRDVSRAFIHSLTNYSSLKNEIFNIGLSNANLSKLELVQKIKRHIPSLNYFDAEFTKDPDQRNYVVSNNKIEKTGFYPKYSVDDGILELIKGYEMLKKSQYGNI